MSYQKSANGVVLTLSDEEYVELLMLLGLGTASAQEAGWNLKRVARLLDSMNAGNPGWMPYGDAGRPQP